MIRLAFLGLVGVALLTSCLSPTQVTVVLSTDVPCSSHPVTTIAVGAPGKAETRTPQTTTTQCTGDGQIGSIVVTPASDNGATFEVQVVLGVGVGNPPSCGKGDHCITARREIAFVAHTPLTLPIELDQVCLGYECPANETCVAEGNKPVCKSAHTMPGCSAKEPCVTSSSASIGAGGAGMGGMSSSATGMGGMSSSSTGMVGNVCTEQDCAKCQGQPSCADVSTDPTIAFKSCANAVTQCGANSGGCCATGCSQTGGLMSHCVKALKCAGPTGAFVCKPDEWDAIHPCTNPNDVPVKAGFLGFQVNTCLPSYCTGCSGSDHVCIPALAACCSTGAPDLVFACVKRDEECCKSTECLTAGEECLHPTMSSDELRCAPCIVASTSSTGGP